MVDPTRDSKGSLKDIQGYLGRFGFGQVHHLSAEEIKKLYRPQEEAILDPSFYLATAVLEGGRSPGDP